MTTQPTRSASPACFRIPSTSSGNVGDRSFGRARRDSRYRTERNHDAKIKYVFANKCCLCRSEYRLPCRSQLPLFNASMCAK